MNLMNNGGPAFPRVSGVSVGDVARVESSGGMTMLDVFTAHALPGLIVTCQSDNHGQLAEWAYEFGRAMLKQKAIEDQNADVEKASE